MSNIDFIFEFASRLRAFMASTCEPPGPPPTQPGPAEEKCFNQMALELYELHRRSNPVYDRFCRRRDHPEPAQWLDIPALPAVAFKEAEVSCLATRERSIEFRSSGTTVQRPARHFHNTLSLELYEESLWSWFRACFATELNRHQLFLLTPPPQAAPHSSLVYMLDTIRRRWPGRSSRFLGTTVPDSGLWTLNWEVVIPQLLAAQRAPEPAMIIGTGFHYVHLLDELAKRQVRLTLPPGTWVMETGGYKGRSRTLAPAALHGLISEGLGVAPERILSEYGMCELSSQAYDQVKRLSPDSVSPGHRSFSFPPWCRVRLLSPETGRAAREGETGLITVIDLANAWSVLAVETEDLGQATKHGFTLWGRASQAEPRGCSLQVG